MGNTGDMNAVMALLEQYTCLLQQKDSLAEAVKENNAEVQRCRDDLAAAMIDAEIPRIEWHGYSWSVRPTTKYSKKAGADEALFEALRDNGLGDLIRETVNAQTLQGAMSELARENGDELPDEFLECVNVYEYTDISRRKAPSK